MPRASIALWVLLAPLPGCGAGDDLSAPTSGILEVTTVTVGSPAEAAAYAVLVDGEPHPIGPIDTLALPDLTATDHEVELAGVPEGCTTAGENPRIATLAPNATTRLGFQVSCPPQAPRGDLDVSIVTFGSAPDADGYSLLLDDDPARSVSANDHVVLGDLPGGTHDLRLAGIAANCEVRDANPRAIDVPQTAQTVFEVTCPPPVDGLIAYTSNRLDTIAAVMDIFLRNASGTSRQNITDTPDVDERQPVWSPDGLLIAFVPFEGTAIFVMNADGSNRRLLVGGLSSVTGVTWSPDGSRLLFVKQNNASTDELTTYSFSTNRLQVLARAPSSGSLTGFCWSPDGSRVAYSAVDFGPDPLTSFVATVSVTGGTPAVVTSVSGLRETMHGWSPDGGTIAYVQRQSDGREDIYLASADGTAPPANLTNNPRSYQEVSWSPDGRELAFIAGSGGFSEDDLFTITLDGDLHPLTRLPGFYEDLSWSKDGSRLLFMESFEIYFINSDGTGRRTVTADGRLNSEASWRP